MNWLDTKMFLVENGIVHIRDNNRNEVLFETLEDFRRCTGIALNDGQNINYEPDIDVYVDSDDSTITAANIPEQKYENLFGIIDTLQKRRDNPIYGVTDQEKIKRIRKRAAIAKQSEFLYVLESDEIRKRNNLSPLIPGNHKKHLLDTIGTLQNVIDNPTVTDNIDDIDIHWIPLWDNTVQYSIGDIVSHNDIIWEATSNNRNNPPDDIPGDWERIE